MHRSQLTTRNSQPLPTHYAFGVSMSSIRFEHVSKKYPGNVNPSVDDCSFVVEAGHFVVLLGPSGCGKTTLLKMVNLLIPPTGGRIMIGETDIRSMDVNQLRRQI